MNIPLQFDQLNEIIYSTKFSYLLLTLAIIYIGQFIEQSLAKERRGRIATIQRELYHQRLAEDSLKMESKELEGELKLAQSIENLANESDKLRRQLDKCRTSDEDYDREEDDDDDDVWSADESGDAEVGFNGTSSDRQSNAGRLMQELNDCKQNERELLSVERNISQVAEYFESSETSIGDTQGTELKERISQLEDENNELKNQLKSHQGLAARRQTTKLDPKLLEYLESHDNELTLSFLEKTYDTLLELKASNPGKDFEQLINELKRNQSYASELAELRVSKKEAEIKLQLAKRRYEEELCCFNEQRVEHILKNCGTQEYVVKLKEKNKVNSDIISNLKKDLEAKRSEVNSWRKKFQEAEAQCFVYCQSWKDTLVAKEQLEAEKKAKKERERSNMSFNLSQSVFQSSASSVVDSPNGMIPPPPEINVPTLDDLMSSLPNGFQAGGYNR